MKKVIFLFVTFFLLVPFSSHPFFWREIEKFDFLCEVGGECEIRLGVADDVTKRIDNTQRWMGISDWLEEMGECLGDLARAGEFTDNVCGLLGFINTMSMEFDQL